MKIDDRRSRLKARLITAISGVAFVVVARNVEDILERQGGHTLLSNFVDREALPALYEVLRWLDVATGALVQFAASGFFFGLVVATIAYLLVDYGRTILDSLSREKEPDAPIDKTIWHMKKLDSYFVATKPEAFWMHHKQFRDCRNFFQHEPIVQEAIDLVCDSLEEDSRRYKTVIFPSSETCSLMRNVRGALKREDDRPQAMAKALRETYELLPSRTFIDRLANASVNREKLDAPAATTRSGGREEATPEVGARVEPKANMWDTPRDT